MITVGVIGYGYWGPNLVRNFAETPGARVGFVTDLRAERLSHVTRTISGHEGVDRLPRSHQRSRGRRRGDRHTGVVALRSRDGGAARRQARARREADDLDVRAGDDADRGGREARPRADGRPHVRLHQRGRQDARADAERRPRRDLLLRLGAHQPGAVPARRQRALGPRRSRSLDHGLRAGDSRRSRSRPPALRTCPASPRTSPT